MALLFLAKTFVPMAGLLAGEHFFLREKLAALYEDSSIKGLPRAFGAVLMVNVVASGLFLTLLGMGVGKTRSTCRERALKEGDKDAAARYSYPKIYAEGFSETATLFNCVQRSHQHALETFTQFVSFSCVAGLKFPVTATMGQYGTPHCLFPHCLCYHCLLLLLLMHLSPLYLCLYSFLANIFPYSPPSNPIFPYSHIPLLIVYVLYVLLLYVLLMYVLLMYVLLMHVLLYVLPLYVLSLHRRAAVDVLQVEVGGGLQDRSALCPISRLHGLRHLV